MVVVAVFLMCEGAFDVAVGDALHVAVHNAYNCHARVSDPGGRICGCPGDAKKNGSWPLDSVPIDRDPVDFRKFPHREEGEVAHYSLGVISH